MNPKTRKSVSIFALPVPLFKKQWALSYTQRKATAQVELLPYGAFKWGRVYRLNTK